MLPRLSRVMLVYPGVDNAFYGELAHRLAAAFVERRGTDDVALVRFVDLAKGSAALAQDADVLIVKPTECLWSGGVSRFPNNFSSARRRILVTSEAVQTRC